MKNKIDNNPENQIKGSDYCVLKFLGLEDLRGITRTIVLIILGILIVEILEHIFV